MCPIPSICLFCPRNLASVSNYTFATHNRAHIYMGAKLSETVLVILLLIIPT